MFAECFHAGVRDVRAVRQVQVAGLHGAGHARGQRADARVRDRQTLQVQIQLLKALRQGLRQQRQLLVAAALAAREAQVEVRARGVHGQGRGHLDTQPLQLLAGSLGHGPAPEGQCEDRAHSAVDQVEGVVLFQRGQIQVTPCNAVEDAGPVHFHACLRALDLEAQAGLDYVYRECAFPGVLLGQTGAWVPLLHDLLWHCKPGGQQLGLATVAAGHVQCVVAGVQAHGLLVGAPDPREGHGGAEAGPGLVEDQQHPEGGNLQGLEETGVLGVSPNLILERMLADGVGADPVGCAGSHTPTHGVLRHTP
mmetsp:Transcript_95328/g.269323  ORF Transcript_95328/g.269323 Transcript_95328/m.269323 type:complete len:308 (+) Transcript_95328:261-1184(+)